MNTISQISVGIDVAKDFLDIHLHPIGMHFRVTNNTKGLQKLHNILVPHEVKQVACEATGGYEYLLKKILSEHGYSVWILEPKRIRAFINSEGIKVKTDKIDARMIALFAYQKNPTYQSMRTSQGEDNLSALLYRRVSLIRMLGEEENRLKQPQQLYCRKEIQKHVTFLKKQIGAAELEIDKIIKKNDKLSSKAHIIESVPGIGKITALTLMAEMPELGHITNKQAASLLGVAPVIKQSGHSKGTAIIKGGRSHARQIFYMATLVAVRHNPKLKEFYERLKAAGKKSKVALIACMRKLICVVNSMLMNGKSWTLEAVSTH